MSGRSVLAIAWRWLGNISTLHFVWWGLGVSSVASFVLRTLTDLPGLWIAVLGIGVFSLVLAALGTWRPQLLAVAPSSSPPASDFGELPIATDEELAAQVINHRRINVVDMVRVGTPIISNKIFQDCRIVGPAVLTPTSPPGPHFDGTVTFTSPIVTVVFGLEPQPTAGVIGMVGVVFRRCTFERVGFAVPPVMVEHWRRTLTEAISGMPMGGIAPQDTSS